MTGPPFLPVAELAAQVRTGELRAVDVVTAALARCRTRDGDLHAFVELTTEQALRDAEAIDQRRQRGAILGPLAGVPMALKDNLLRQGMVAASGSRMLEHFVAPYSATVVERIAAADAVILGRTNMDKFGMGSSTEHSAFGPTRNPWARDCVPGGSSGGAAAAVAADLVAAALGSDTGGSVRQPAALCGVTGLKPTYGRLSRHGLIAYASSLDCIGVLGRSAADVAAVLAAIAGGDDRDATSLRADVADYGAALAQRTDLRGLRIGVPWQLNGPGLDAEVAAATGSAVEALRQLGAVTVACELKRIQHAIPTYYLLAAAEASSNLARYDGIRFGLRREGSGRLESMYAASRSAGFGAEVQLRILLGTFALRAGYHEEFYGRATRVRALLRQDFARAFADCELIACPTSPVPAFPLGSKLDDPLAMYLCDALTVPMSLAGLPALSLPCGFTAAGLPVGLQLTAPALQEQLLLQTAHVYQQHTDFHRQRPAP
ncbi:MAG TPA: Asp-tRNA(Asn)/Glu-tRNA(Gln) amidotransferase subunit GatA [Planctomycetota bacterium]|nr:Asp-tRNA(Asn)/Glu-tRNA(Gln) amidotransferase subunit GatA [Planctomycetota bacterium]